MEASKSHIFPKVFKEVCEKRRAEGSLKDFVEEEPAPTAAKEAKKGKAKEEVNKFGKVDAKQRLSEVCSPSSLSFFSRRSTSWRRTSSSSSPPWSTPTSSIEE